MPATCTTLRTDVYTRVTDWIVAELKKGVRPWQRPWDAAHAAGRIVRPLRSCGEPYRGINILMLWDAAERHGFAAPRWLTFQQARQFGGSVRKGERGSPVVYASSFTKKESTASGDEVEQEIHFLKEYTVFNAEQCDGLPERFRVPAEPPAMTIQPVEQAEAFFVATKADIRTGGGRAYYTAEGDYIRMPPLPAFRDAESHAATLAHELVHWTKHPTRLARDFGRKRFGDEGYAVEELVAELGAAFLCADLAITPEPRDDHASYIANWLGALRDDKRMIFTAASHASKAADFLHGLQPVIAAR